MKFLVVGAGLTGATLSERLSSLGHIVTVIDRRNHIGGNAYDYIDESGVLVNKYGPHIFHTNSDKIWEYLSRFTEWRPYEHKVLAHVDGKFVPLPVNFKTIRMMFKNSEYIIRHLRERYRDKVTISRLLSDYFLKDFAKTIYDKIFYNYTVKQWGMTPDQLDSSVLARVPVRMSHDDRYFTDKHQAIPKDGYTKMIEKMLENVEVKLNISFNHEFVEYDKIIFTGCIDEFFGYELGKLPYRSLRFSFASERQGLDCGTINYPNEYDFTRVTDMRVIAGQRTHYTTLCYEYPEPYKTGKNEPYYPIPAEDNQKLYNRYSELTKKWKGKVWFAGRLGEYKYYNMDQAVGSALALFEKEFSMEKAA